MDIKLTIGVSTNTSNLDRLNDKLSRYADMIDRRIDFLVSYQSKEARVYSSDHPRVTFTRCESVGLSENRNTCIHIAQGEYIWFQDDDIEIDLDNISSILAEIVHENKDLYFVKIGSLEEKNALYKNYSFFKKHSSLNFLKISSIEIIVKVSFIKEHKINFDRSLGLGTQLPCCEENKFILDCFNHSASIFYVDCVACYHTTLLSNRNIDYMKSMQAKGYLLSFVPHWLAIVLFIRWGIRFSKISELSLFMCFRLLLQGYFIRQKAR